MTWLRSSEDACHMICSWWNERIVVSAERSDKMRGSKFGSFRVKNKDFCGRNFEERIVNSDKNAC